jgi:hypothetical protein
MTKAFVVAMAMAGCLGCGGWTKRDTILELGSQASFFGDWRQTRAAIANRDMSESNPVIGTKGETMSPDAYFLSVGLLHAMVAAALPPRWRTAFQLATVGAETYQIVKNHETFDTIRATARRQEAP